MACGPNSVKPGCGQRDGRARERDITSGAEPGKRLPKKRLGRFTFAAAFLLAVSTGTGCGVRTGLTIGDDASRPADSGSRDAAFEDARPRDAEPRDSGSLDIGLRDAGPFDGGSRDAGPADGGLGGDGGVSDAGVRVARRDRF